MLERYFIGPHLYLIPYTFPIHIPFFFEKQANTYQLTLRKLLPMKNQGLLFIPDISGFTRFVNETEIDHSRLIIQELLEILINANHLGLEISEIEGDAILFYKFGTPPDLKALYEQVQKMFVEFHRNIVAYERRRYCQLKIPPAILT